MSLRYCFLNRGHALAVFLTLAVCISLISGCGRKTHPETQAYNIDTSDVYSLEVVKDRKEKDLHFLRDASSPLLESDRAEFEGLPYFPPDRTWAFECTLQRFPQPKAFVMATSKDSPRDMLHIGYLPFTRDGKEHRLNVFAPRDTSDGNYWFIPFTDASTGGETYAGGRFLDIESPGSDTVFLDFNYAYNPLCAYNPKYDCPIPPAENRLAIAIPAGEKKFKAGH